MLVGDQIRNLEDAERVGMVLVFLDVRSPSVGYATALDQLGQVAAVTRTSGGASA